MSSGLQGCYYYRCFLPMAENGWDGDQTSMNPMDRTPEDKAKAAQMADVVVFHRPDEPNKLELARMLKKAGKKIVYDNDDTYKDDNGFKVNGYLDEERLARRMKTANETLDDFIREADLVTTTTEVLADEYRKLNDNVVVLPNCIDPYVFDEPLRNETDKIRVGFTGSVGCTADFQLAVDLVNAVDEVTWVMFSLPQDKGSNIYKKLYADEYKILDTIDLEWQPFVNFNVYFDTLNELRLDIMAIPRQETYFNKCKSNLKFLEASMFEIPVVAQGFSDGLSPYQVDKEDAEHMLICNSTEEFAAAIRELAENKEKRLEMGRKARAYVTEKYDIANNGELWQKTYQTLFKNQTL